ncbi:glycine dehydrogenase subunit 1 [Herbinix hemicellulosilytica]|uniref:Probable glycine dehydrogenase (decarboxylating) subunit 1 n=1 Tax=Herbinix hemicellulosilytica TaxID=1564487 RepID=A0A0H5SDX1_HERHM|nr:aminomethyl-transferring glycine dehydrogenase subunit GcvPA [Herbinix hemicellulosilytica]RBP60246.1 glycine dehydrogenase subunit 1 [Herbinix hemicellulosilytica]CRZ33612.1 putative glycine dehydrogenase [decarboxylating] subunit 1 [Herbinix hemicellulosilytica]
MGTYVPNTKEEQQAMLKAIGLNNMDELFDVIPKEVRIKAPLDIPGGMSEMEVARKIKNIAGKNKVFQTVFRGCGAYRHYIPAIVKQVTSKEEFITAYTPYQAEISQGILQSIFEYQTMICELTGMDVSNASVYDGATAAAEAVIMSKERNRKKALVSATVNPMVIETIATYLDGTDMELELVPAKDGLTDLEVLKEKLSDDTACVLIQQPNFYGLLEDGDAVGKLLSGTDIKYIMSCNPISLGILKTPAEYGADIAVGEGQPLGISLSFGGPYLGFMATTNKLMRRLPGRIVGETKDSQGRRAYVLTLQAREQHIRREKASSNICSNQALCAMTAAVYLAAMGKEGLKKAAVLSMSKAHYLAKRLCEIDGYNLVYRGEFFNEFVTTVNTDADKILKVLEDHGILGGYPLSSNQILWCATEVNTKEEIDMLIEILKEVA